MCKDLVGNLIDANEQDDDSLLAALGCREILELLFEDKIYIQRKATNPIHIWFQESVDRDVPRGMRFEVILYSSTYQ